MTTRSSERGPAVPRQDHGAADAAQEQPDEATAGPTAGHADDRISEAVQAAQELAEETGGFGVPGRPLDRRSPSAQSSSLSQMAVQRGAVSVLRSIEGRRQMPDGHSFASGFTATTAGESSPG